MRHIDRSARRHSPHPSYMHPAADRQGAAQAAEPANARLAPPGPYMLFLINGSGVPSVAKTVMVGP